LKITLNINKFLKIVVMNRICLLSILLSIAGLKTVAQNQTYTQAFDSLFSNVPYSTVVSGILYDRIANFSDIELFNQQTTDTSSYACFMQAYSELHRAITNPSINPQFLIEIESLKERLQNISYIPIGIINARYDIIDTNAVLSGKLYESNGLFYVNNAINGSLFAQEYALLAAPLSREVDSVVIFGLSSLFVFENHANSVSSISIDFDDGSGLNNYIIGNTNIVVQYATEGLKIITIQIYLSNGNIITTYARLKVIISKTPKI
jgi:hypothetical protein